MEIFPYFSLSLGMEALGWTVLHSLWQGAVVGLVVAVAFSVLPRRSAQWRYGLAVTGLFSLMAWTLATFCIQYQAGVHTLISAPEAGASGEVFDLAFLTAPAAESGWAHSALSLFDPHVAWIAALWLLGALGYSFRWAGSLVYLHRLRKQSKPGQSAWQLRLNLLLAQLKVDTAVELLVSSSAQIPMVVGYLKPAILVPAGMLTGLSSQQIEAILIHEIAHIKRYDYLVNMVQSIAETLFFYHPAFWWLNNRIQDERENCCDDLAVAITGDALSYARALTELAGLKFREPRLALGLSGRRNHLLERIQRLLSPSEPPVLASARLFTGLALALTLWGMAWFSPASVQAAPDQQPQPVNIQAAPQTVAPQLTSDVVALSDTPPPPPPPLPQMPAPPVPDLEELPPLPPMPAFIGEMPDYLNPGEAPVMGSEEDRRAFEQQMLEFSEAMKVYQEKYTEGFLKNNQEYLEKMAAWKQEFFKYQEQMMQELQREFPEGHFENLTEDLLRAQQGNQLSQSELEELEEKIQREMEMAERSRERGMREVERAMQDMERELRKMESEEQRKEEGAAIRYDEALRRQEEALRRQEEAMQRQQEDLHRQEEELRKQEMELKEQEGKIKKQLLRDGFISSPDDEVEIYLKKNRMTINGEQVDDATFKRYSAFFEHRLKILGVENGLESGSHMKLKF